MSLETSPSLILERDAVDLGREDLLHLLILTVTVVVSGPMALMYQHQGRQQTLYSETKALSNHPFKFERFRLS